MADREAEAVEDDDEEEGGGGGDELRDGYAVDKELLGA